MKVINGNDIEDLYLCSHVWNRSEEDSRIKTRNLLKRREKELKDCYPEFTSSNSEVSEKWEYYPFF